MNDQVDPMSEYSGNLTNADMAGGARHPWIAAFEADPAAAYDRFIRGYADVSPYQRAEVPDAARLLFGSLPADDPVRALLGTAITGWLNARRREPIPADSRRRGRLIREISESFEIIRALEPDGAAQWVHDNRIGLMDWTSRLVDSSARDARAAFLLTLAVTQPVVDNDHLTRLIEAANQARLAFAGYVSVQTAINKLDEALAAKEASHDHT